MIYSRFAADFERAFAALTESKSPVMPSDIQRIFNDWWRHVGQFECASGQPDHKEVIFNAFLSGWDYASRLNKISISPKTKDSA